MHNFRRYTLIALIIALIYFLVVFPEFAKILAGVAILLIGMTNLSNGFKSFSGGLLEKILKKSTDTRFKSISFGVITTILMQSSTLVSIISISFLSAGLITLAQGIGIVFGANLGNSAGSWLIVGLTSINISMFAIPLIVCGTLIKIKKDLLNNLKERRTSNNNFSSIQSDFINKDLRNKLRDIGLDDFIKTVRGVGYKVVLEGEV